MFFGAESTLTLAQVLCLFMQPGARLGIPEHTLYEHICLDVPVDWVLFYSGNNEYRLNNIVKQMRATSNGTIREQDGCLHLVYNVVIDIRPLVV